MQRVSGGRTGQTPWDHVWPSAASSPQEITKEACTFVPVLKVKGRAGQQEEGSAWKQGHDKHREHALPWKKGRR